ncbi:MAG: class II D-tagatose-bisphosphate aldolase, non-catalytic subunit [Anaerolineales bacterium]
MYLDDVVAAQKRGEVRGITSICSAHPWVLRTAMQTVEGAEPAEALLIEATCNQVNQYGGYTGMTPRDFAAYVRGMAHEAGFPFERILLGGDHLGPNVWQDEPAETAMRKAEELVCQYVQAGFTKIHLDCSMKLADDPPGALDVEVIAQRTARLARAAESALTPASGRSGEALRYVIGTEVPIPGGATAHEEGISVTRVDDAKQTIEVTRAAFLKEGLAEAWTRVAAVVVQPGVEFGDAFVLPYQPEVARALSQFIESQPLVYEAHSTDYQTREALTALVRDQFAILKVGPALTFAFREAVFALAMIENEWVAQDARSNIIQVLDDVMVRHPAHWKKYYHGDAYEQAFKRKYSLSDRARYYWGQPEVQDAFQRLMTNLGEKPLPYALLSQFVGETDLTARQVLHQKVGRVLETYRAACNGKA